MTKDEAVNRWLEGAQKNLSACLDMAKSNHRDWALFIGQLTLEKLLKGLITKNTDTTPPFIHDLVKLSQLADIETTEAQKQNLAKITRFHVAARYEEIKSQLYSEATPEFTKEWLGKIQEFFLWFKKLY